MIFTLLKRLLCISLTLTVLATGSAAAATGPVLNCRLQQGETITHIEAVPTDDPYRVEALRINRFRFKAVVVGDTARIDYVNLYTYYETGTGKNVRLLQEAKFLAPQPQSGTLPRSLTGTVYLYEPTLGREFSYDCVLRENAE